MSARVDGYGGIRETYEVNPDGSVTTLRTRLGWPAFETTSQRTSASAPIVPPRGFVAKVPGGRAVLFNPYTLAVLKSPYLPASNSYSVQDFGTSWNVAPADTTHWYDVVLFDGTTIKVNSKAMPSLRITANHGFTAIPYVINRDTSDDQYGNAERNTTEKRVFAVGRFSVKSWGGGGVVETLTPSSPREEYKAMTLGQVVSSDDVAHLWQMYYTGDFWDSPTGEWYFSGASVQMLLSAAYLVKTSLSAVSAAHNPAAFGSPTTSSGTSVTSRSVPDPIMELVGHAELEDNAGGFINRGYVYVHYPWDGYTTHPINAYQNDDYVFTRYYGESTSSADISGKIIEISCQNQYDKYVNSSFVNYPSQFTDITANFEANIIINKFGNVVGGEIDHSTRQGSYYGVIATRSSGTYSWTLETSDLMFSSNIGSDELIQCHAHRSDRVGKDLDIELYNWAQQYLDDPRGGWNTGNGYNLAGKGIKVEPHSDWDSAGTPEIVTQAAQAQAIVDLFIGDECRSNLEDYYLYIGKQRHTFTQVDRNASEQSLSWSTKDYLLYDEANGVYITVEGIFSGANSAASLTVNLRVKTRHSDAVQTLHVFTFAYSELVPLREIGTTGNYAIQSPQIRSIFAPIYQEQGSFKGAHYVTLDEESNGATAFHGFNFMLYLRPYSNFDTCNEDNDTGQAVYFVPCNLLEMLYSFVFSSDLGVAEDGTRYPVTHSANFTALMSTLFSNPVRVSVRNGTVGGWTDALGSDFASVSTVSLHRA